jgi:DNA-binding transcriptional LysR family regulator
VIAPESFDISRAQNTFRMAMVDATAALWLPSLVRTIMRDAPRIKIRMMPLTTRDPRAMLLRGDIDLAVGFFPGVTAQLADGQGMAKSQISHARLYTGQYVCVMHKNHPLAGQPLTLDSYCSADHLLVSLSGNPCGHRRRAGGHEPRAQDPADGEPVLHGRSHRGQLGAHHRAAAPPGGRHRHGRGAGGEGASIPDAGRAWTCCGMNATPVIRPISGCELTCLQQHMTNSVVST